MSLRKTLDDLYGRPDVFLRRLRSELLLHQKTIYQLCKVSDFDYPQTVYRYFDGSRRPGYEACVMLDEAMDRLLEPSGDVGDKITLAQARARE